MFVTKTVQIFLVFTVTYCFGIKFKAGQLENTLNSLDFEAQDSYEDTRYIQEGKDEIMNTLDKYIRYKVLDRHNYDNTDKLNKVLVKRIVPHTDHSPDVQYDYNHNIIYKPLVTIHKSKPVGEFKGFGSDGLVKNNLFDLITKAAIKLKNPKYESVKESKEPFNIAKYEDGESFRNPLKHLPTSYNTVLTNKRLETQLKSRPAMKYYGKSKKRSNQPKFRSNPKYVRNKQNGRIRVSSPNQNLANTKYHKFNSETPKYKLINNIDFVIEKASNFEKQKIYKKILNILDKVESGDNLRTRHLPQFYYDSDSTKPKKWLPEYGYWNYWTYDKTIHQDDCPGTTVRLGNVCVDALHH